MHCYIKEEESSMLSIRIPVVWIKDINHVTGHTFSSCKKILISKTNSLNSDTSWDLLRIDRFMCIPRDRAFLVSWPRKQMKKQDYKLEANVKSKLNKNLGCSRVLFPWLCVA